MTTRIWVRGAAAGVVAATTMAIWFLLVDAAAGEPFRTPALIANSMLGVEDLARGVMPVLFYTLIHYAVFILVGIAATWVVRRLDVAPGFLMGLVFGFILFDAVFYGSVYLTGLDVARELGWMEVFVGNLIAGISLTGYLHLTGDARPVTWWEALADHRVVREGVLAGLVGAVVVAVWFFAFDAARGSPFFTPAALGSAIFLGASDIDAVDVTAWTVIGYTVLHVAAFVVIGLAAAVIVRESVKTPPLLLGALLLFVAFEAFFLGLLAVVAEFLLGPIAWWSITIGNLLAVAGMGWYLWKKHPRLKEALAADPFDRRG